MTLERVPTGCSGLDRVLFGGVPVNTITVLMGAPGTGKTILAEQIAFHNATPEARALYLTTLAEPLDKFIAHGQSYSFFDPARVGVSVFYEDLGLMVREKGIEALPEIVTNLLIEYQPRFVFIDSFKALNELLVTLHERRTVMYDVASVLSAYHCTSFLIGEYAHEMMTDLPEFAIADVVLHVSKVATNVREQRFIRVEKLRASNSIQGMHALSISEKGVEVFPRLLTPLESSHYTVKLERVSTGISGLDAMIEGGFWRGSTTLVAGPTGSGKTVMGLHFVRAGVESGEPSIYVGFQENPTQLTRIMQNFGWDPTSWAGLEIMYRSPVEMQLDSVTTELFERVRSGKVKRVVVDALGDLERCSVDRKRFSDFIYALTQWFAVENVTCLLTYEISHLFEIHSISQQEISNMSDNIVLLRFRPAHEMERTIRVIKTRGSSHDNREFNLRITNKGVEIKKLKD